MTVSIRSEHVCPPDRELLPYIALFVNSDNSEVIVQCKGNLLGFPRFESPEAPHFGEKMCACFRDRLEEVCETRYDLLFLHASINNFYCLNQRPVVAMFQCVSPIDDKTNKLVSPSSKEYKWMSVSDVEDLIDNRDPCWRDVRVEESGLSTLTVKDFSECSEEGYRPWELPMWHTHTTNEAKHVLSMLGYVLKGDFEQFIITHNAAVLRVTTNKGRVYLKASNRREGKITDLIAGFAPQLVRKPIFVNEEKEWMLMDDYGTVLDHNSSKAEYEKFCIPLGQLHLKSMEHLGALKEAGLPFESCESLIHRAKKMLKDDGVRKIVGGLDAFRDYTTDGVADLQEHCIALCKLLRDLYEKGKCPLSVVHGDLPPNLMKGYDGFLILFDWGAARVDVPLCDIMALKNKISSDALEEYLKLWEKYASPSELRSLFGIVRTRVRLKWVLDNYEYEASTGRVTWLERIVVNMLEGLLLDSKEEVEKEKL